MSLTDQVIDSLYKIMCSATSTVVDSKVENNDYFKRRVLGFKAEIEFEKFINRYSDVRFLEGGQFISKKLSGEATDKNVFIYTTIAGDEPSVYQDIYKIISMWDEVIDLIYIKIEDFGVDTESFEVKNASGGKEKTEILVPKYRFYKYIKVDNIFVENKVQDFGVILNCFNRPFRSPSLFGLRRREQFDYLSMCDLEILKKYMLIGIF
jgi:hypothetical protein